MKRTATVLLLVLGFLGLFTQPVGAYTNSNEYTTYNTGRQDAPCLITKSTIDRTSGGYDTFTATAIPGRTRNGPCVPSATSDTLTVKYQILKWDGGQWFVCRQSDWFYSSGLNTSFSRSFGGYYPSCGRGYYGTHAYAGRLINNTWVGFNYGVWSGYADW